MDDDERPILDCADALARTGDTRLDKHIREDAEIALAMAKGDTALLEDAKALLLAPGATLTLLRTLAIQDRRLERLEHENEVFQKVIARIEAVLRGREDDAGGSG